MTIKLRTDGQNRLFQSAQLTVVDCDGTMTASKAANVFVGTCNLDSQTTVTYHRLVCSFAPPVDLKFLITRNTIANQLLVSYKIHSVQCLSTIHLL